MHGRASQAGDRLIGVGTLRRHFVGEQSLNFQTRYGASIDKRNHFPRVIGLRTILNSAHRSKQLQVRDYQLTANPWLVHLCILSWRASRAVACRRLQMSGSLIKRRFPDEQSSAQELALDWRKVAATVSMLKKRPRRPSEPPPSNCPMRSTQTERAWRHCDADLVN